MSTPVGHTLAGLSICFLHGAVCHRFGKFEKVRKLCIRYSLKWLTFAAFLACAPDIDFVPGMFIGNINYFHHRGTHSLFFAVVLSLCIWFLMRIKKMESSSGWGLISFLLIVFHLGIDYVTIDKTAPFGIPFLWPFSARYFYFQNAFLPETARGSSMASAFNVHNLRTILCELIIYMPLTIISYFLYKAAKKNPHPFI